MRQFTKFILITLMLTLSISGANAQRMRAGAKAGAEQSGAASDSSKKGVENSKDPVAIEKFFKTKIKPMIGLTPIYKDGDKYFISVNDTLLGRDIIMVTRIAKAAEAIRSSFDGYSGDQINEALFVFEKGPGNKLFLRKVYNSERSRDSTQSMYQSLMRSNLSPIISTFDIKAQSADKTDHLIEVTSLFNSDVEPLFFRKPTKAKFKLGALQKESSYISDIVTYPINTEVKTVKTYMRTDRGETATYELNNSFVLLPKKPMTPRFSDDRVGYFTTGYTDYDLNPQGVEKVRLITRWRLEPKPEDLERYMRGELVEPQKPIVFYIDPTTPEEWVPYLIQGVNDWQDSFEKAGFKNAILGKRAPTPEEDPEWSLEDARYSAIVYKPSNIANASGPHVSDPRSGEIIESHINWYHNVMSLLRNWYFIQCSPVDPAARKMTFDTELMGQLVRFVSSHEVGHTLGLRHNFGGTANYTVEQLRDPKFLKENGHTTSIMDYSRFNYVAQPEDNIPRELLFPRISHYDRWAIEWGYRLFPDIDDPVKEKSKINSWIIEKTKDRRYWFGTESSASDPRMQSEDLGENQMVANELGIKNLKVVMDNLGEWTKTPNDDYKNLRELHGEVANQFRRYIGHVVKWVGGVYQESLTVEMEGDGYRAVEKEKQQEAMHFLDRHLFTKSPNWLVPDHYLNKFPSRAESILERSYKSALSSLLSRRVIMNLIDAERLDKKGAYTVEDLFVNLNRSVWNDLGKPVDTYRRVLQKSYVYSLCDLYTGVAASGRMVVKPSAFPKDVTECTAIAYNQMIYLLNRLKRSRSSDFVTNAHNQYMIRYIEKSLSVDSY